jgi:hypothetical protein
MVPELELDPALDDDGDGVAVIVTRVELVLLVEEGDTVTVPVTSAWLISTLVLALFSAGQRSMVDDG